MKWLGVLLIFAFLIWRERRKVGTKTASKEKEMSRSSTRMPVLEYYVDAGGEYRWRLKAGNGKTIASSGEGYKTKAGVEKAAGTVAQAFICHDEHWKND